MRFVVFVVCVLVLSAPLWVKSAGGEPYLHYTHYRHPPNVALAYVGMLGLADAGTRHGNKTLLRWQDADGNWHYSDGANAVAGSEAVSAAELGAANFVRRDGKDKGNNGLGNDKPGTPGYKGDKDVGHSGDKAKGGDEGKHDDKGKPGSPGKSGEKPDPQDKGKSEGKGKK